LINVESGEWEDTTSGINAGRDSFYEYLLKSYILFGDQEYLDMFSTVSLEELFT
jgi:mannosidase alpha-like ER degradation enhancer 1